VADTITDTTTDTTTGTSTETMTETEPAVQTTGRSAGDGAVVDALPHEAVATAAKVQQEGGDSPAAAEPTSEAAAASTTAENAPPAEANRSVSAAGGIGSGIEDLDALLAEVAQESAPAGDDAQATASANASREVAETPATADDTEQATGDATSSQGSPQANEVAQMESHLADGNAAAEGGSPQNDAQTPPDEKAGTDFATAAGVRGSGLASSPWRLVCAPLDIVAVALEIVDTPFARLSPRTKAALGYVGIATLAVAAAVWFAGPAIMSH
jgi:hypothetical protein